MVESAAILFGIVFLLIGILGFVPTATQANGVLLGIFHINAAHNTVHIGSGIIFFIAGMAGVAPSGAWFRIFGIIYALVALLRFYYGHNAVLGLIANNTANTWLDVVLAVVMLYLGFGASTSEAAV